MKNIRIHILIIVILTIASGGQVFCQKPIIKSIDRQHAANNELITLTGSNFGSDPNELSVAFGAVKGKVEFVSNQVMEVRMPAGATYQQLAVSNISTSLTGYSNLPFLLSYNGETGFELSELDPQKDFDAKPGLHDMCACDFDGDTRPDFIATSEDGGAVALLANTSTGAGRANISFSKTDIEIGAPTVHASCGDLNGDGKPDVVISEAVRSGNEHGRIFILVNTSTGENSFSFSQSNIAITGKFPNRLAIADIDSDGRPDLVMTNQSGKTISVVPNTSVDHTLTFSTEKAIHFSLPVDLQKPTGGLSVTDLNGDDRPEILTSQFLTESNIFIYQNKSTPGDIQLSEPKILNLASTIVMVKTADLNQDNKPEIVASLLLGSSVAIFENTSSDQELSFADYKAFSTDERPYGFDFGDLDGDGKVDIAVASILNKSVSILNNNTTGSNLSFSSLKKTTNYINRHVSIVDADGDGKPDITFTSIDDNGRGIPASKLSILRNKHCLVPKLLPEGPHTICEGKSIDLYTTPSKGLTYDWKKANTLLTSGVDSTYSIFETGTYTVTTTSSTDACTLTSNTVHVTVETSSDLTEPPVINAIDAVCTGTDLTLTAADVGATNYKWSGPDGYHATGLSANPPVFDFQRKNAGRYTLEILAGSCVSESTSIVVEVLDAPSFELNTGASAIICGENSKTLTVSPVMDGFTYQWYKSDAAISGANGTSLVVTNEGIYHVKATTTPACASGETDPSEIIFATAPVASFEGLKVLCPGQSISFENTSTGDEDLELLNKWDFADGTFSNEKNPTHSFAEPGEYKVKLRVYYDDKGACIEDHLKTIVVGTIPEVNISTEGNTLMLCPGETLTLRADGVFETYAWSEGGDNAENIIEEPGTYTVTVTNSAGCEGSASVEVGIFPEPEVVVTAERTEITEGESVQLSATGLQDYSWTPTESVDFTQGALVNVSPTITTVFNVTGKDLNGCPGEGEIEILVKGDLATKKITPSKFFSPENGDDINKYWNVDKIQDYPRCGVEVFDEKGVRVFAAKPYLNDWNGTFNGNTLPDGVYFYIIKCDGEENSPKTGSITILR